MKSEQKPLVELIAEQLKGGMLELPVFNSVAVKLQQTLSHHDFKLDEIIAMINEDQSLASKVLKVANSTYYAGLSTIATIKDAIVRLGAQEVANMVMVASQQESFRSENEPLNNLLQQLWVHSFSCASGAQWLAKKSGYINLASECFMAGLLHDIGQLALLKVLDDIYRSGKTKIIFSDTLICEVLDRMHQEIGGELMRLWSLPQAYCDIAANHHKTDFDNNDILAAIVRLSDKACKKIGKSLHPEPTLSLISSPEALVLRLNEVTMAELEIFVEDVGEMGV